MSEATTAQGKFPRMMVLLADKRFMHTRSPEAAHRLRRVAAEGNAEGAFPIHDLG